MLRKVLYFRSHRMGRHSNLSFLPLTVRDELIPVFWNHTGGKSPKARICIAAAMAILLSANQELLAQSGACCWVDANGSQCADVADSSECQGAGQFFELGVTCASPAQSACEVGKCEYDSAPLISCRETIQGDCDVGFTFTGGSVCAGPAAPFSDGFLVHVDKNAATADPSSVWSTAKGAFTELSDALDYVNSNFPASSAPVYILVAEGIYSPDDGASSRDSTFSISAGVRVIGGFAGSTWEDAFPYDQKPDVFETILTGDLLGNDNGTDFVNGPAFQDNAYHVITFDDSATGAYAALEGVIVQHGVAGPTATAPRGGGVYVDAPGADVRIKDVQFRYCYAEEGGAVAQDDGELYLDNCRFKYNRAQAGGALAMWSQAADTANMYVRWTRFIDNLALDIGGAFSGVGGGSAHFMNCIFRHNVAIALSAGEQGDGGAVYAISTDPIENPTVTFGNCLVHEGLAFASTTETGRGRGGAFFFSDVTAEIKNCTIALNASSASTAFGPNGVDLGYASAAVWVDGIILGNPVEIKNTLFTLNGPTVNATATAPYLANSLSNNEIAEDIGCNNGANGCFSGTDPWVICSNSSFDNSSTLPPDSNNVRDVTYGYLASFYDTSSFIDLPYSFRLEAGYYDSVNGPTGFDENIIVSDLSDLPVVYGGWLDGWTTNTPINVDLARLPRTVRYFDGSAVIERAGFGAFQAGFLACNSSIGLGYYFDQSAFEQDNPGVVSVDFNKYPINDISQPYDSFQLFADGLPGRSVSPHFFTDGFQGDESEYLSIPASSGVGVTPNAYTCNCFENLAEENCLDSTECGVEDVTNPLENCFFVCQSGTDQNGRCLDPILGVDCAADCIGSGVTRRPEFCLGDDAFIRVSACDIDPSPSTSYCDSVSESFPFLIGPNLQQLNDRLIIRVTQFTPTGDVIESKRILTPPYSINTLPDFELDTSSLGSYSVVVDVGDMGKFGGYSDDLDRRAVYGYEVVANSCPFPYVGCCDSSTSQSESCVDNDNNGVPDYFEIWADPTLDSNSNCVLDSREMGCPKVDLVFIFDTSSSIEEFTHLCSGGAGGIVDLVDSLAMIDGIDARATIMSVSSDDFANPFSSGYTASCMQSGFQGESQNIIVASSAEVRFDQQSISQNCCGTSLPVPEHIDATTYQWHTQDWGIASVFLAQEAASPGGDSVWREGALRILIPVSDTWPCGGLNHSTSLDSTCKALVEGHYPFAYSCLSEQQINIDGPMIGASGGCDSSNHDIAVDDAEFVPHLSITDLLIETAVENQVIVSPIISQLFESCYDGSGLCIFSSVALPTSPPTYPLATPVQERINGLDVCLLRLADAISSNTGGVTISSTASGTNIAALVQNIVYAACANQPCPVLTPAITYSINGGSVAVFAGGSVAIQECDSLVFSGANTLPASGLTFSWCVKNGTEVIASADGLTFDFYAVLDDVLPSEAAAYTVTLTVTDTASLCVEMLTVALDIDSTPLVDVVGSDRLDAGELGTFTASTFTPCDDIVSIRWLTGDPSVEIASGSWPAAGVLSQSFATPGLVTLTAEVTDSNGDIGTGSLEVSVSGAVEDGQLVQAPTDLVVSAKYHTVELLDIGVDPVVDWQYVHTSEMTITNRGPNRLYGDIVLAFDGLLPTVATLDGFDSGTAVYSNIVPYVTMITDGESLAPNASVSRVIRWNVPQTESEAGTSAGPFEFEPIAYLRQQAPVIISDPDGGIVDPNPDPSYPTEFLVTLSEGEFYSYQVEARDPEAQPLQYLLESVDPAASVPAGMSLSYETGLFTWTPDESFGGATDVAIRIKVSDGYESDTQTIRFAVTEENRPPVFQTNYVVFDVDLDDIDGLDGNGNPAPESVTIPISVYDPDGDVFKVVAITGPAENGFDGVAGGATQSFDIIWDSAAFVDAQSGDVEAGLYLVDLFACDCGDPATEDCPPTANSCPDAFTSANFYVRITDAPCDAGQAMPIFDTATLPIQAVQGEPWEYQPVLTPPLPDVSFALETGPDGMQVDEVTGLINWVPPYNSSSSEIVTISAYYGSDPSGTCRGQFAFNLIIEDRNAVPQLDEPIPTQYIDEGEYISYIVEASDIDGDRLRYQLLGYEILGNPAEPPQEDQFAGLGIHADSGRITWAVPQDFVPFGESVQAFDVNVRITDAELAALDVVVTIEVARVDVPPVIRSRAPYAVIAGTRYEYLVDVYDPDSNVTCAESSPGVSDDFCYELILGPGDMAFSTETPNRLTWNTTVGDAYVNPHSVIVEVNDGDGIPAVEDWTITVYPVDGGPDGNNRSPNLEITSIDDYAIVGVPYEIHYITTDAIDPSAAVTMQLAGLTTDDLGTFVGGIPDPATGVGVATWTPVAGDVPTGVASAIHTLLLTARDNEFALNSLETSIPIQNIPVYDCDNLLEVQSQPVTEASVNRKYEYVIDVLNLSSDSSACSQYTSELTIAEAIVVPSSLPVGLSISTYQNPIATPPPWVKQFLLEWDSPTTAEIGPYDIDIEFVAGQTTINHAFTINVNPEPPNVGPQITSYPPSTTLFINELFEFDLTAFDPDHTSEQLNWNVTPPPNELPTVTQATSTDEALFEWLPTIAGSYLFEIDVTDGEGSDRVSFTLEVVNPQDPDWQDGDTLAPLVDIRFEPATPGEALLSTREPMEVDNTESVDFVVLVSDDLPFLSSATVDVTVSGSEAVSMTPSSPLSLVAASGLESIGPNPRKAVASFDFDPSPVVGVYIITATITDTSGKQAVATNTVSVFDGSADCENNPGVDCLNMALTALVDESEITLSTIGSVPEVEGVLNLQGFCEDLSDPDSQFDRYELAYRPAGRTDLTAHVFHTSYSEVNGPISGDLGELDTTIMPNGTYDVMLTGYTLAGSSESTWETIIVTGDRKVGNFTIAFDDLQVPVVGIPATVTRSYDSRDKFKGDFGYGWQLGLASMTVQESYPVGYDWQVFEESGFCYYESVGAHTVSINWPDGRVEVFTPQLRGASNDQNQGSTIGGCIFYALDTQDPIDFVRVSRGSSTIEPLGVTPIIVQAESNELTSAGVLSTSNYDESFPATPWEPTGYLVTTQDGTKFEFSSDHLDSVINNPNEDPVPLGSYSLRSITDRFGNQIIFEEGGIRRGDSTEYVIRFERDPVSNLITSVIDPEDNAIVYEYDENEDLISVTDRSQHVTRFVYNNDHGLVDIIDPRGVRAARNIYDDDGKLITIIDAENNRTEFIRPERTPIPTGGIAPSSNLSEFAGLPNETDLGVEYDCTRFESILDPTGVSTIHCYNSDGNVTLTMTVGSGGPSDLLNHTVMTYDSEGRQTRTIDATGRVSEVVYDGPQSDLVTEQRSGGRLVAGQLVDAKITRMTYNEFGQILTTRDPLNVQAVMDADAGMDTSTVEVSAQFQYDPLTGAVEATYDAAGFVTLQTYEDQTGQLATITDRNGKISRFKYYEDGNIKEQIDPAGNKTEFDYDLAGRRTHTRQTVFTDGVEVVSETQTVYDESGRAVQQIDGDGNVTTTVYNNIGKVESVTDPLGRVTSYEYDLRGNLVRTTYPNGSTEKSTYDVLGRQVTSTDRNGRVTTYVYDERGNRVETLLPGGIRQRTEYDGVGRTKRTYQPTSDGSLPDVVVSEYFYEFETFALSVPGASMVDVSTLTDNGEVPVNQQWVVNYVKGFGTAAPTGTPVLDTNPTAYLSITYSDLNGRTIKTRDARSIVSGDEYYVENEYDINGRLDRTVFPAASAGGEATYVRTEYDNGGRAIARIDQKYRRTETIYDDLGRVSKIRNALQHETEYVYGPSGRLMTQFDALDRATSMTYDVLGRMKSRTRPMGQIERWVHDDLGNLVQKENFRGQTVEYTYDDMNNMIGKYPVAPEPLIHAVTALYDDKGDDIFDPKTTPFQGTCEFQFSNSGLEVEIDCQMPHSEYTQFTFNEISIDIGKPGHNVRTVQLPVTPAYAPVITDFTITLSPADLHAWQAGYVTLYYDGVHGSAQDEAWGALFISAPSLVDAIVYSYSVGGDLDSYSLSAAADGSFQEAFVRNDRNQITTHAQTLDNGKLDYNYDPSGNRATVITTAASELGGLPESTIEYQHDELNRLVFIKELIDGDEKYAYYGYDANGNRAWAINLNGTLTTYAYDRLNRLTRLTNKVSTGPGAAVISDYIYILDAVGNRTRVVEVHNDASGDARQVDYTYDELDRLTQEVITNDPVGKNGVIAYTYDAVGNRLTKTSTVPDTAALVTYAYDANDRLLTETRQESLAGMRRFNDGTMMARGPPAAQQAAMASAGYRPAQPSVWSGRIVIGVVATSACALLFPLSLLRLRRRDLGRAKRRRHVWRGTISLFCLPLMLVGGETVLGLERDAQLYRSMQAAIAGSIGWCEPLAGATSVLSYNWDDDGNMIQKICTGAGGPPSIIDNEYDAENRLVRLHAPGGDEMQFVYDPWGVRRRAITNGVKKTVYLIDKQRPYAQVVAERQEVAGSPNPDQLTLYSYGDDLLSRTGDIDAMVDGSTPADFSSADYRYYHYDGQMSTRQLTDDAATPVVTDTYTYDAFGTMLDRVGVSVNSYLYNGEQYDGETRSYYLRARYYDQSIGRFTNADPFDGVRNDPMSLHKYLYAHANPVMNSDPSGLVTLLSVGAVRAMSKFLVSLVLPTSSVSSFVVRALFGYAVASAKLYFVASMIAPMLSELRTLETEVSQLPIFGDKLANRVRIVHSLGLHFVNDSIHELAYLRPFILQQMGAIVSLGKLMIDFLYFGYLILQMNRLINSVTTHPVIVSAGFGVRFTIDYWKLIRSLLFRKIEFNKDIESLHIMVRAFRTLDRRTMRIEFHELFNRLRWYDIGEVSRVQ